MTTQTTPNLPKAAQLVALLGNPDLNLQRTTADQIAQDESMIAYNPAEAIKKLRRYSDLGAEFYLGGIEYGSPAIYVHYKGDGIRFFSKLSLFSSMLSNVGFRKASLLETEEGTIVYLSDFNGSRAANNEANRKLFREKSDFLTVTAL
jgi:hypothetical protein